MIRTIAVCVVVALAAGCASPAYRIRKHPDLFASFPPEVQDNVRAGRVEIGYTTDMVFIALGRPNRVYTRQSERGSTVIWSYAQTRYTSAWRPVETMRVYRDRSGRRHYTPDVTWVDVGGYTEYEAVRLELAEDKVTAIEVLNR